MRGFFGIGAVGISKAMNVGALFRTAHAFEASFVFTVDAVYEKQEGGLADTSSAVEHLPFYSFPTADDMLLPKGCKLVGIELLDDAYDLPSFRHPPKAAYILGPERGSLSPEMIERCDYTIKIPTKFCINVSLAGALVMYDRAISLGKFGERPMMPGGKPTPLQDHIHGAPILRKLKQFKEIPPADATYKGTSS